MQSDADKTPEPKITSHDVHENEGGGRSESDASKTPDGSTKSETQMNQNPLQICCSSLMKMKKNFFIILVI